MSILVWPPPLASRFNGKILAVLPSPTFAGVRVLAGRKVSTPEFAPAATVSGSAVSPEVSSERASSGSRMSIGPT